MSRSPEYEEYTGTAWGRKRRQIIQYISFFLGNRSKGRGYHGTQKSLRVLTM